MDCRRTLSPAASDTRRPPHSESHSPHTVNDLPIALETKDLIGILLIVLGSAGMTGALLFLPRLRPVALFLLAAGTVATDMFDLNIYSAYWDRGTTRGFE
ncbi:MAG: O-Antigen ligase, partial [Lacunisphaera sp.]|nr:O-Antigen ligase [Lacunisphaera sp.]